MKSGKRPRCRGCGYAIYLSGEEWYVPKGVEFSNFGQPHGRYTHLCPVIYDNHEPEMALVAYMREELNQSGSC